MTFQCVRFLAFPRLSLFSCLYCLSRHHRCDKRQTLSFSHTSHWRTEPQLIAYHFIRLFILSYLFCSHISLRCRNFHSKWIRQKPNKSEIEMRKKARQFDRYTPQQLQNIYTSWLLRCQYVRLVFFSLCSSIMPKCRLKYQSITDENELAWFYVYSFHYLSFFFVYYLAFDLCVC